jgi:acetolactate synthase-1/2/3 large subunit
VRDEPGIRLISTRPERATTYMADGYARVSGKPSVALVMPGVGIYNAAAGLATTYARSSPVLIITDQVPRADIGKNAGAVHEVLDQAGTVRPITKWQREIMRPRVIPAAVNES